MRDTSKNKFRENIKEINEEIKPTLQDIQDEKDEEIKKRLRFYLLSNLIERTITHYSVGDSKEVVKGSSIEIISVFEDAFVFDDGFGDMDKMCWLISLAILCDVSQEEFNKIKEVLKRDNVQDKLLDYLIKYKDPTWSGSSNNYIQKEPYASVDTFLTDTNTETAVPKIKHYLDKIWYKGHDESHWHGTLENDNLSYYFGYWAWEVAAIVKINGIDDTALKNQKYYPYDAVHW